MQYAILDADGNHVTVSRNGRTFGVNRNIREQQALRREGAIERQMYRATLSPEAQLGRINERPGLSLVERTRLLVQVGDEEAIEAVKLIITGLKEGTTPKSRRLGAKFEKQYAAQLVTA